MRIVADDGIDRQVVERLRQEGHEVDYVAELSPGISDEDVFELASSQRRLLVMARNCLMGLP